MDELQRKHLWETWLGRYWHNRTLNVPKRLNDTEMMYMIQWLFKLEEHFESAVNIVIKGPKVKVDGVFWHQLRSKDVITKFPKATTKLIVFLLDACEEVHFYEREIKDIYQELVKVDPEVSGSLGNALLKKQIEVS